MADIQTRAVTVVAEVGLVDCIEPFYNPCLSMSKVADTFSKRVCFRLIRFQDGCSNAMIYRISLNIKFSWAERSAQDRFVFNVQ